MKTTLAITTTFDSSLLSWVDYETKLQKKTRRDILEQAVKSYQQERMREGFLRAAHDPDIIEMTEWGMNEYANDIKNV